jgi:hypothetical protein
MIDFEPTGSAHSLSEPTDLLDAAPSTVISWGGVR